MRAGPPGAEAVCSFEEGAGNRSFSVPKGMPRLLVLATLLVCAFQDVRAETRSIFRDYYALSVGLNLAKFDELGDLTSSSSEIKPDSGGFGPALGGYVSTIRWGEIDILAGMELGFFEFGSVDYISLVDEPGLAYDVDYLTASMKFRFGRSRRRYFDVDLGLGRYKGTSYFDQCDAAECSRTIDDSSEFGLYTGVSGRVFEKVVLGLRIHDANFDVPAYIGSPKDQLSGLIYSFLIGWEFGNW